MQPLQKHSIGQLYTHPAIVFSALGDYIWLCWLSDIWPIYFKCVPIIPHFLLSQSYLVTEAALIFLYGLAGMLSAI